MLPAKRLTASDRSRYRDPNTDGGDTRARVILKKETRRTVAPTRGKGHDRKGIRK